MTRFLSVALGAEEPNFSQSIRQLERAAGEPQADIRLTESLKLRTQAKIAQLGLDPKDTTGEELYGALLHRLSQDEALLRNQLSIPENGSTADIVGKVQQFLQKQARDVQSFVLKPSVAKRLLKKKPPRAAMKQLGYRSLDSMLKHVSPALVFTAAFIAESPTWQRSFRQQYNNLSPSDFEMRSIEILSPREKRWQSLSERFVQAARHNIVSFKELGAVVMLPLDTKIDALAMISLLFACEEMNAIRAHSSFVKLQQVKPNFGQIMRDVCTGEAYVEARIAGQRVSWKMIQRYYAQHPGAYHEEIFEPHVQPEDLTWIQPESILAEIVPELGFWQGTQSLGLLHENGLVSCNVMDIALSQCNKLPFTQRVVHFVRNHLRHELMLGYLQQENLEQALRQQLVETLGEPVLQEAFN
jgi:hypothetical protein